MKKKLLLTAGMLASVIANAQLYNTISGTIWEESNGNNLRDGGEQTIAGILVNLENSSNVIVSSAISGSDGVFTLNNFAGAGTYHIRYAYPSKGFTRATARAGSDNTVNSAASASGGTDQAITPDFTISTNANLVNTYGFGLVRRPMTITYWASKASTPTDWTDALTLKKSNDAVGITNNVTVFVTGASYYPTLGIENTSTSSGATGTVSGNGQLTLTVPTLVPGVPAIQLNTTTSRTTTLSVYDGNTDFGGTSGTTFNNIYGSGFVATDYTAEDYDLSSFRSGTAATFSIPASVVRVTSFTGGGNLTATSTANAAAGALVTYTYPVNVTPLPLSILSFSASKSVKGTALLQWKASAAHNISGYSIQRSSNGSNYTEIAYIEADKNNASGSSSYTFEDMSPLTGKNIYRLQQITGDGEANYSQSASLTFDKRNAVALYPNPASASVIVEGVENGQVNLYNQFGQHVPVQITQNGSRLILNTSALPAGLYSVQIVSNGLSETKNIIVQHP